MSRGPGALQRWLLDDLKDGRYRSADHLASLYYRPADNRGSTHPRYRPTAAQVSSVRRALSGLAAQGVVCRRQRDRDRGRPADWGRPVNWGGPEADWALIPKPE